MTDALARLRPYLHHKGHCHPYFETPCSCGLAAVLAGLEAAGVPRSRNVEETEDLARGDTTERRDRQPAAPVDGVKSTDSAEKE